MTSKARWMLFLGVALLLTLPAPGRSSELCPGGAVAASGSDALLALLQPPQAGPGALPDSVDLPTGQAVPKATFCTKEVCSVARQECREWCPFPCQMEFQCVFPSCGSCISCSC